MLNHNIIGCIYKKYHQNKFNDVLNEIKRMAASIKSIPMPNKCGGGILYMNTISSLYQPCSYEYDEHINSKRRCFCAMKRDYRVYGIDSMYIENSYISLPYTIYKKYIYNVTEMNIRETVLVYNYKKYVDGRIENLM